MWCIRAMRVCVVLAIAGLGVVASARAATTPPPLIVPAVAVSESGAAVAWTAGGVVQTASMKPDGTFGRGEGVGRAFDGRPPQLVLGPGGDELLLWQSGNALRSAFRAAGQAGWTFETVASGVNVNEAPCLVMDATGRAIASWVGLDATGDRSALLVSTRSAAGWSAPAALATTVFEASMASDTAGDVAVAYLTPGSTPGLTAGSEAVWAATLPSGATTWTAPEQISGSDSVRGYLRVVGGGARTFVAAWGSWISLQNDQPLARAARLRIPGTWSAPGDVLPQIPNPAPTPIPVGPFAGEWTIGVDGLGDALAVLPFPTPTMGEGLGVTHLAAGEDAWAPPAVLAFPDRKYGVDLVPAIGFGDDGTATLAFVQIDVSMSRVRVVTAPDPLGVWPGLAPSIDTIAGPDAGLNPPAMALGSRTGVIAVQLARGDVIVFARTAPGARWTPPQTLRSTGATTGYLLSAHVKKGIVRVMVNCGIPPCTGDVVLEAALRTGRRRLGRVAFDLRASGTISRAIVLPTWTRLRFRHGRHLLTHLAFDVREGDGASEQIQRTIRLHG